MPTLALSRTVSRHPFVVDQEPDRPLGSLLVHGVFDLLTSAGHDLDADDRHLRMSLNFTGFRGNGGAFEASAEGPDERWTVAVHHGDRGVCHGQLDLFDGVPRPRPDPRPGEFGPKPASLAHRAENVVIGAPRETPDSVVVPVLTPARGHYLSLAAPGVHGVRTLVEAAWQFTTLLAPRVTGVPVDGRFAWLGVAADLPTGIPIGAPLELCWRDERATGTRLRFRFDLFRADLPGEPLGTFESSCAVLDVNPPR